MLIGSGLKDLQPRQVIEGDIILDFYTRRVTGLGEEEDSVIDNLLSDAKKKRKKAAEDSRVWPNATIPYVLGSLLGKQKFAIWHHLI